MSSALTLLSLALLSCIEFAAAQGVHITSRTTHKCLYWGTSTVKAVPCDLRTQFQEFTYSPDHRFQVLDGGCLYAKGMSSLHIDACANAIAPEEWVYDTTTGQIKVAGNGNGAFEWLCLEETGGQDVCMQECNIGSQDQTWNLNSIGNPSPTDPFRRSTTPNWLMTTTTLYPTTQRTSSTKFLPASTYAPVDHGGAWGFLHDSNLGKTTLFPSSTGNNVAIVDSGTGNSFQNGQSTDSAGNGDDGQSIDGYAQYIIMAMVSLCLVCSACCVVGFMVAKSVKPQKANELMIAPSRYQEKQGMSDGSPVAQEDTPMMAGQQGVPDSTPPHPAKEDPLTAPLITPSPAVPAPLVPPVNFEDGLVVGFILPDATEQTVSFGSRRPPLGLNFSPLGTIVPLAGTHAAELGIGANWKVKHVNGTQVSDPANIDEVKSMIKQRLSDLGGAHAGLFLGFALPDGSVKDVDFSTVKPPIGLHFSKGRTCQVTKVNPGGPADSLGVKVGWIVRYVNGQHVGGSNDPKEALELVKEKLKLLGADSSIASSIKGVEMESPISAGAEGAE